MQTLIEQLQHQKVLLFLGYEATDNNAFGPACQALAQLPVRRVVTLGGAPQLIAAWRQAGRAVEGLTAAEGPASVDESRVTWLAVPPARTPEPAWLGPLLRTWFASHTVCFLGCNLEAPEFKQRYRELAALVGPHRPPYRAIVSEPPAEGDRRYWQEQNVQIIVSDPLVWVQQLLAAWTAASPLTGPAEPVGLRPGERPYQFLDYYQEADAGRFFGRTAAIQALGEQVLAERLVVCFGPSGVGKSSLLQAGLMPRLRQQGCLPLYCRPEADPIEAIRQAALVYEENGAALPRSATETGPGSESISPLAHLLARLARHTGRTVVVLLDQFEEVFTLLGEETLKRLAEELAGCLRWPGAPVHGVLCLREDFLARLHALQPALPAILSQRYRLKPLTRSEAQAAIETPVRPFGLRYEPALTRQLLDDLGGEPGLVAPTDLQIVCDALYRDASARGQSTFRLERYQVLGGMAELLGGYLERVVEGEANPAQVRAVFKAMVTGQGTRTILSALEIAHLTGLEVDLVEEILSRLDRPHRLVRPLRGEGTGQYELAHEVLGPRILAWIADPTERAAKTIHDLLRAELHTWRNFAVLPGAGKLRAVHAQRDNPYLRLGRTEVELMVRGAIAHGVEPAYWLERAATIGVPAGDFLQPALASPQAEARQRAAELLGPELALRFLSQLLGEADPEQRRRAVETASQIDHPQAVRLLRRYRHDPVEAVRAAIWEGLQNLDAPAAARLRRQDELAPLLLAGSVGYWLLLLLTGPGSPLTLVGPAGAVAGGVWLLTLLVISLVIPRWPQRLLAWTGGIATGWLLIAAWGWWRGGLVLLLIAATLGGQPHLALAGLLPYLPWLGSRPATPGLVLGATAGSVLLVSLLALIVPRWGRYRADRPLALAWLSAGLGAAAGGLLTAASDGGWVAGLVMGLSLAVGRRAAKRPLAYSGGAQGITDILFDLGRALWDLLDQISFKLKPFLGGLLGALWGVVLLQAAASLAPDANPTWTLGDAVWLGLGLGVGLWPEGGLIKRLLWVILWGGAGGWLAQGWPGAVFGALLGLGLALGEWLAVRLEGNRVDMRSS